MEPQDILQDTIFVLLYGGVIMLSVAAALYLLLRRGNALAPEVTSPVRLRRWAAAFLLGCALSHVLWMFWIYYPTPTVYVIACGVDLLLLFPSIAGILLSMLQDRRRPVWPIFVTLVPVLALFALSILRGHVAISTLLSISVIVLYALMMLYMYFAVRRYGRWLRDNYADLEHKEVWQSLMILALFLLFFVLYDSTSGGNRLLAYLLQIDCIIIVVLLLWRVETLQQLSVSTSTESEPEPAEPEQEPVREQKAPTPPSSKIATLLEKHCENKQLYLQNGLTLAQLANAIGTNRTYLSQHFAQQGITYNAYINGLRIRHFVRLYEKAVAEGGEFTAQQLALESGFHSYSTFSATFKQNMGTTVTAWMHSTEN